VGPSRRQATMGADWKAYAERPHFFGKWDYPSIYYHAIKDISGVYIDVGVGDGYKLKQAIDEGSLSSFSKILAFDISPDRIDRLKRHVPSVVASVGDALALPLPDASADFIISDQVIEHVPDDRAMAREICRVLTPRGRAIIGSVVKEKGAWYFYRCNGQWRLDPTHLREYESLDQYANIFVDAGLEVIETAKEPLTFPIADLLLRSLLKFGALKPDSAVDLKERVPALKMISGTSLRIPRYYSCYAIVRRA
jgi:SAM-dependent methyltransferase